VFASDVSRRSSVGRLTHLVSTYIDLPLTYGDTDDSRLSLCRLHSSSRERGPRRRGQTRLRQLQVQLGLSLDLNFSIQLISSVEHLDSKPTNVQLQRNEHPAHPGGPAPHAAGAPRAEAVQGRRSEFRDAGAWTRHLHTLSTRPRHARSPLGRVLNATAKRDAICGVWTDRFFDCLSPRRASRDGKLPAPWRTAPS
jgi:hypothetical protein